MRDRKLLLISLISSSGRNTFLMENTSKVIGLPIVLSYNNAV